MNRSAPLDLKQFRASKHDHYLCQVKTVAWLNPTVVQVHLVAPLDFPQYQAGQYIEVVLADGTSRPFSIANFNPDYRYLELHIEANPGSQTTRAILDQLRDTQQITVKSAKGDVCLTSPASPQVFLAAGSGFSQIKALIQQLIACQPQGSTQTPLSTDCYLLWGTETPEQRYMIDLIRVWLSLYPTLNYRPLSWQQGQRWESALAPLMDRLVDAQFYLCGSPNRVYTALDFLELQGIDETQMHSDVLSYAPRPLRQHRG
ncbi:MAG: CDP-4-dehydro-6-deoxyglucose reductase [Motiliproteus sp.]|jgi:CDP-4-dehydro-6-deoxyglucose reductase